MKIENTLAKNITATGDKAAYDASCKKLLANKIILAWIMKSCLEEYKEFGVDEIAGKYIEGEPNHQRGSAKRLLSRISHYQAWNLLL